MKWDEVMEQRGQNFINTWTNYKEMMKIVRPGDSCDFKNEFKVNVAIVHISSKTPVPGVNGIIYAMVRYMFTKPVKHVYGIVNGMEGLIEDFVLDFSWKNVSGLTGTSGSLLGTMSAIEQLNHPTAINDENVQKIEETLQRRNIYGLCFVGDNLGLQFLKALLKYKASGRYERLRQVKFVFVPAAVDPNEELVQYGCKLGYDSMLNKMFDHFTDLRMSIMGTYKTVYFVRMYLHLTTMHFCHPSLFGAACGAINVYPGYRFLLSSNHYHNLNMIQYEDDARQLLSTVQANHFNQVVIM